MLREYKKKLIFMWNIQKCSWKKVLLFMKMHGNKRCLQLHGKKGFILEYPWLYWRCRCIEEKSPFYDNVSNLTSFYQDLGICMVFFLPIYFLEDFNSCDHNSWDFIGIIWNSIGVKEYNIIGIKNLRYTDYDKGWDKIDLKVWSK